MTKPCPFCNKPIPVHMSLGVAWTKFLHFRECEGISGKRVETLPSLPLK